MRCGQTWTDEEWFAQLWEAHRKGARLAPANHGALDNIEGCLREALESGLKVQVVAHSIVQGEMRTEVKPRERPVPPPQTPPGTVSGGVQPPAPQEVSQTGS